MKKTTKATIRAEAQRLAASINYDHSLSRDARYALSMRLSQLQRQLGALGVDAAAGESDES